MAQLTSLQQQFLKYHTMAATTELHSQGAKTIARALERKGMVKIVRSIAQTPGCDEHCRYVRWDATIL